jgi:hypothetical protein
LTFKIVIIYKFDLIRKKNPERMQQQPQQQQSNVPADTTELEKIYQWINDLCSPVTRENALIELRLVFRG